MSLDYRVVAVFANVLLDQLGLPIPAVPTLIVAGALAANGQLSASALFCGALLACLIADSAWYVAGRLYGNRVMKLLCRISLTPDSCVSQTQQRFEQWGANALVVAKFVPGLSIIAPPLAGATRMGWLRFVSYSAAGSSAWIAAAVLAGIIFQQQIGELLPRLARLGIFAAVLVGGLLAVYVAYKWWERRRFYALLRMARISVAELYSLIDGGAAPLIVDVRSPTAVLLEPRRIPGALQVPLQEVERHVRQLPRDREIVAYCTCPNEASAAQVARLLMKNGFKRVRPLHGGLDAWIAAGYALEGAEDAAAPHPGQDRWKTGGGTLQPRDPPQNHIVLRTTGGNMGVLKGIGVVLIVAWLVLWLFVKITFAAIHLLLLLGLAMLVFGFLKRETAGPRT